MRSDRKIFARFVGAMVLCSAYALAALNASAQTTVCAEVRLEIKQESTLEREAFDAALEISNQFPNYGLENSRVEVVIKDPAGNPADGSFYVRVNSKEGVTAVDGSGVVQPATTANVHWLVIPSTGAGGVDPLGLKYAVSAVISYKLNGVYQSISTYEDYITVKPQPVLKLEYMLPFEVFSDEPLTEAITEPVEPFSLGVRVGNVGYGAARNFKIDSGKPEITENKQGLAVDAKLLGAYVGNMKLPETLLVSFGDIAPGGVAQAAWIMSTALSGRFIKFDAGFSHADELGGQLTSLVQAATTYTLIKDVLVDLPGRDSQFDFLVNTVTPRDTMYDILSSGGEIAPDLILESDQAVPITVERIGSGLSGALGGANTSAVLKLTGTPAPGSWVYSSIPAPLEGKARLLSAVRSDGKVINTKNAWISRHFIKSSVSYVYRLNLLDYNPPPLAEYTLNFALDSIDSAPAAITDLGAFSIYGGTRIGLSWSATGEDGAVGAILGGHYFIQTATGAGAAFDPAAAQVVFGTNTAPGAMQNYPLAGLMGNATHYFKLWLQDTGGNISAGSNPAQVYVPPAPPVDLLSGVISSSAVSVTWSEGNNNTPIEYGLRIDTDAFEPAVGASPFKDRTDRSFVFTGLTPDTTYWMYGSARNPESGAMSAWVNLGSTATLAARPGALLGSVVGVSSCSIVWDAGGNPAWTQYQAQISTTPDWASISGESGWVKRTDYVFNGLVSGAAYYLRAKARNTGGVETGYTDLGMLKTASVDLLPPVTQIVAGTPAYRTEGELFITSTTILNLSAADDAFAAGDKLGVVAAVYYSVDPDAFSVYAGTFTIAGEGGHRARFYSVDAAGNAEAVKTSSVTVDNSAPVSSAAISGVFQDGYYIGPVTVTLTALDAISGVAETDYALDGGGFAVYVSSFVVETNGLHSLVFRSKDRLGNQENDKTVPIDLHIVVSSAPAEITPSSGPIGLPFVITGAGFGGYKANLTTVLIGGTTAPITSWSTTTIKGTVPGALPPGEYPVSVTRGTTTITEVQPFTVTLPVIYALTPSSGPIGMPFVLAGASFGNYKAGYTRVLIGGATAQITSWTDLTIKAKAPGSVPSGDHALLIERELNGGIARSNVSTFSILTPEITAVTPSTGSIGAPFTISGLNFGNYLANYTRVLIGVTTVTISSWHDTSIKALVPGKLSSGDYELAIEREQAGWIVRSSTAALTVADPEMGIITPSSGPIGLPFTITGTGFGNYKAGYTRVLLGDTTAPITSWTDTAIKGTVPGSLTAGEYETAVEREMNGGFIRSSTVTFTVTMPYISTVTPISGPIGLPVVITGNSFGNYKAGYTRVLIGGTTAPVTSWTDQTIKATVPGGLATGDYELAIERELNGGIVRSSTWTFTVIMPVIQTVTPSSGPIGLPVTITGTNFGNYRAGYTRVLLGDTTAPITSWTDLAIKAAIPGSLPAGDYELAIERELNGGLARSSTVLFTITAPYIAGITPSTITVTDKFVITGGSFGNYSAGKTAVLINGATSYISSWTDIKIQGKLPFVSGGQYPVVVSRAINGGLSDSPAAYITVVEPVISSMTPVRGAGGTAFSIYGAGFGNYDSTLINGFRAARVVVGALQANISSWTDLRIKGIIPDSVVAGSNTVTVVRAASGGLIVSNAVQLFVPGGYGPAALSRKAAPAASGEQEAELILSPDWGGTVETSGRSAVVVPEGALPEETVIRISADLPAKEAQDLRNKAGAGAFIAPVGPAVAFGPEGLKFNNDAELMLPYETARLPRGKTIGDLSIYWWDAENNDWVMLPSETDGSLARLKAKTGHFSVYQVMAKGVVPLAADPTFTAGEHYAYPNPAKGNNPTFYFECGQADSAHLTVYDISGRKVYDADMGAVDATGAKFAYKHVWDVRNTASGVYLYVLRARKAGYGGIMKKGKVAVIR